MPANILNLPCYKVRGIQENEHDYHIEVETKEAPAACPHCQPSNLVGFGRREQMVKTCRCMAVVSASTSTPGAFC